MSWTFCCTPGVAPCSGNERAAIMNIIRGIQGIPVGALNQQALCLEPWTQKIPRGILLY